MKIIINVIRHFCHCCMTVLPADILICHTAPTISQTLTAKNRHLRRLIYETSNMPLIQRINSAHFFCPNWQMEHFSSYRGWLESYITARRHGEQLHQRWVPRCKSFDVNMNIRRWHVCCKVHYVWVFKINVRITWQHIKKCANINSTTFLIQFVRIMLKSQHDSSAP